MYCEGCTQADELTCPKCKFSKIFNKLMITEDYVSFEVAKLLKEKGFDEKCISVYHDGELQLVSSLGVFCGEGYGEQILTYTNSECEWSPIMISAPTLWGVMKWLREVHKLFIFISPWLMLENNIQYYFEIREIKTRDFERLYGYSSKELNSFEKVTETAIKYCLENLIN
jgi:hypothetical protein